MLKFPQPSFLAYQGLENGAWLLGLSQLEQQYAPGSVSTTW